MRKGFFALAFVAVFLLFAGCTETEETTVDITTQQPAQQPAETPPAIPETEAAVDEGEAVGGEISAFAGFPEWKVGMWSETESVEEGVKLKQSVVEKTGGVIKIQTEVDFEGEEMVTQIWYDETTKEMTEMITKSAGMVMCFDAEQIEGMAEDVEPEIGETYEGQIPDIGYGTYTTPTGKTVSVAKFKSGATEMWVSDEVPFGIVKIADDSIGDLTVLYDFGTTGAVNKISAEDLANCQTLPVFE